MVSGSNVMIIPATLQKLPTYDQFVGTLRYLQMKTRNAQMQPKYLVILFQHVNTIHVQLRCKITYQISKL